MFDRRPRIIAEGTGGDMGKKQWWDGPPEAPNGITKIKTKKASLLSKTAYELCSALLLLGHSPPPITTNS